MQHDQLPPGVELARLLASVGFQPVLTIDDSERYVIRVRRLDG